MKYTLNTHIIHSIRQLFAVSPAVMAIGLNVPALKQRMILRIERCCSDVECNYQRYSIFHKKGTHQLRPDGSSYTSFPSAHTANAFTNAEILRREYKDLFTLYGVVGYTMAICTGYLRMYNNKHWLSDVVRVQV
jgi:membrane-associated phospholipid phosphatase